MSKSAANPWRNKPLEAFYEGQLFYCAAKRCLLNNQISPTTSIWPGRAGAVNHCLASELFIKSLLLASKNPKKGHPLDKLFAALEAHDKAGVQATYTSLFPQDYYSMQDDIRTVKDYFTELRYMYEDDDQKTRSMDQNAASRFSESLYTYCANLHGEAVIADEFPTRTFA